MKSIEKFINNFNKLGYEIIIQDVFSIDIIQIL